MPDRARAALLERILSAVPGGVVYFSPAGIVEVINDEAVRLAGGLGREKLIGRHHSVVDVELWTEDGTPVPPDATPLVRALAGHVDPPRTYEYRVGEAKGWAVFRATRLAPNEALEGTTPAGVVISFVDISDRIVAEEKLRSAEERWRMIASNVPDTVVITDVDGHIEFTNRLFPGYTLDMVLGTQVWDWVEQDRRAKWREQFYEALRTRKSVRFDTIAIGHRGGTAWYESILVPLVEGDDVRRLVVLGRDVTERRMILARVAEHDRLASLGLVAASVAHEIMNPLTYVLVNLELAMSDRRGDVERTARALADAREGALRMQQIVRDLRSLGRSASEELFYVDMRAVVESAMRLAGPELAHAGDVELELDDMPAVLANESRLCQVFINLLVNAAQAVRDRPTRRIRVRSVVDAADAFVGIAVSDSGPGVDPTHLPFIFEPFYTTKAQGTGLGLSITRDIVTRMGGRVDVDSRDGEGATFTVWLPTRRTPHGLPTTDARPA